MGELEKLIATPISRLPTSKHSIFSVTRFNHKASYLDMVIPFLRQVPSPWSLKLKMSERAVKNLMIIPEVITMAQKSGCNKEYWHIMNWMKQWVITSRPIKHTFTQGRICWIASSGLRIWQNFVTFPAAAMRTSASLSRRSRTYAGTRSVLDWGKVNQQDNENY